MSVWVRTQLEPITAIEGGVAVVVDSDSLVDPAGIGGTVEIVDDWWSLRATYERVGRRRQGNLPLLLLVMRPPLTARDLPWDIEQTSKAIVTLKLPGPTGVREALLELDEDELDRAAPAVAVATADPVGALFHVLTGMTTTGSTTPLVDQLRVAMRLALRTKPAPHLVQLASRRITHPVLAGLLQLPPDCRQLQQLWNDFLTGGAAGWRDVLRQAEPELASLFAARLLQPVVPSGPTDEWTSIGTRRLSDEEQTLELLESAPAAPPTDMAGWQIVARWWGDVRRLLARTPAELREAGWTIWEPLNEAFVEWLRERYGMLLTSAAAWPPTVHRVGPFLARRLREGNAERILLIVLDGLGHAQWAHLLQQMQLDVIESGSTCALVPTYTTVSRQAIFAGDLPLSSPGTLWTTEPEARRWRELWTAEGVTRVLYYRVKGRLPNDRLGFGDARAIGVVVNAVDDLMHSSELFGDAQLLANLDVWAANGFLVDIVSRAHAAGIETWITADHGNLECLGVGTISEGVAIEAAGKRLLRYQNKTLRNASAAQGVVWDEIPGLPATAEPLLFAAGRTAFTNNRISVSHGGLSLDEVIVPLARVAP